MSRLKNLSVRLKVIMFVVPCIFVILALLADRVRDDVVRYKEMTSIIQEVELLHFIAPILNELQKERGRSNVFLADINIQDRSVESLRNQYRESGIALTALLTSDNIKYAPDIRDLVSDIPNLRQRVLRNDISVEESFNEYTKIIKALMLHGDRILKMNEVPNIMRYVGAFTSIAWLTEIASRERSLGAAYLHRGIYNQSDLLQLVRLQGQQDAWIDSVDGFLLPYENVFFSEALASPENISLIDLRKSLNFIKSPKITAGDWFMSSSNRIDVFSNSKKKLLKMISIDAGKLKREAWVSLIIGISVIGVLAFLIACIVVAFTREAGGHFKVLFSLLKTTINSEKIKANNH